MIYRIQNNGIRLDCWCYCRSSLLPTASLCCFYSPFWLPPQQHRVWGFVKCL